MKILAFDLAAYKFGFATGKIRENSKIKEITRCGKVEVGIDKELGITNDHERSVALMMRAFKLIKYEAPDLVLCEDTRIGFANNKGLQDFYTKGNLRYLELYLINQKIAFNWVSIGGWKGTLFGKAYQKRFKEMAKEQGKTKIDVKKEAIKQVKLLYPNLRVDDDDAAEASALIHSVFSK